MPTTHLAIVLKAPLLGLVKTRLAAAIGPELALGAYKAMVACVLAAAEASGLPATVHFAPDEGEAAIREFCGPGYGYQIQVEGDLGARMAGAMAWNFARGAGAVVLVGGDVPLVTGGVLRQAARELEHGQAVLGPATDGGYYLLGIRRRAFGAHVFRDMPWSTAAVAQRTLEALEAAGTPAALLPVLPDCDTVADLRRLALSPWRERLAGTPMDEFLSGLPAEIFDQHPRFPITGGM